MEDEGRVNSKKMHRLRGRTKTRRMSRLTRTRLGNLADLDYNPQNELWVLQSQCSHDMLSKCQPQHRKACLAQSVWLAFFKKPFKRLICEK